VRVGVRGAVAQHGHQRDHPGAAADQVKRTALVDRPRVRPADRSADLELVAGDRLVDEIGRDLAVLEALDRQLDCVVLRRRGDRVRARRLIAVLGGQAHVDVVAGAVAGPLGHVEDERARGRGFGAGVADGRDVPADRGTARRVRRQSFQYRCSFHGSPWLW
jgi:hypothetical protein